MVADKTEKVVPSSLLGKAVGYILGQWDKLIRYLDRAELTPDNNAAERSIRPFVLGQKNFLFSGSPRGSGVSCNLFSIIETVKQNGMNPYAYLYYLISRLPEIRSTGQVKRDRKLCTGIPSSFRLVASLRLADSERCAGATIEARSASAPSRSSSSKSSGLSLPLICHST